MAEKTWLVGLYAIVLVAALFALGVYLGIVPKLQTAVGGGGVTETETGNIITTSTTLTIKPIDAITKASVGGSYQLGINGGQLGGSTATTSTSAVSAGDTLDVLFTNNTQYHNLYLSNVKVPNSVTFTLDDTKGLNVYKNASVTLSTFNTNDQVMTNGGGATNQTDNGAGSAYNIKLRMVGQDQTSTQDLKCLVEVQTGANVSKVTWDGKDGTKTTPSWYTLIGSASNVYVFEIAPITNAVTRDSYINIQAASAKTLGTNKVKIGCYTKDWFLDSNDGKVKYDTEDSIGTLKSMASYSTSFYFT